MKYQAKRLVRLILLFVISLIKLNGFGQDLSHTINGQIIDEESKLPLPYTTVCIRKVDSTHKTIVCTQTDDKGYFYIIINEYGRLELYVADYSHLPYKQNITFEKDYSFKNAIALKTNAITIEGVELTAKRKGVLEKETGTASLISKEEIELKNPTGTGDALQSLPGIFLAGDDGFGNSRLSISIRGLDPRRSARTLILEDGIPIQPAPYIYPNSYYNPPIERIDKIEVIKGSASIKYGPQTMGGVINYITTRPKQKSGGIMKLTGGTYDYGSLLVDFSGIGKKDNFKTGLQLLVKRGDGFRENNDFRQYNITVKNLWQISSDKTLYTKLNYNNEFANATYTGLTDYSFKKNPLFNPKKNDEFKIQRIALDVIYSQKHSDKLSSRISFYANHFKRDWWRENDVFIKSSSLKAYDLGTKVGFGLGEITPQQYFSNTDLVRVGNSSSNFGILRSFYVIGVEKQYNYKHKLGKKKAQLVAGFRLHNEIFKDNYKIGDSPTDRVGKWYTTDASGKKTVLNGAKSFSLETRALSAYAEEEVNLTDKLLVNIGLRTELFEQSQINRLNGNQFNDKTSFVLLPGIGFNYALDTASRWNVFGGLHRGYTAPSSAAFSLPFINTGNNGGTIKLTPEKSWNTEFGLRSNTKYLQTEMAIFYNIISDIVTAARGTIFFEPGSVNTAGLEFSSHILFNKRYKNLPTLHFNYTYLYTRITKAEVKDFLTGDTVSVVGKQMPYAPTHSFVIGLQKKLMKNKLTLFVDYVYSARVFADMQNLTKKQVDNSNIKGLGIAGEIPNWGIWNTGARYKVKKTTFSLTAKNFLDKIYISSRLHSQPGRPTAGQSSGILIGSRRQVNLSVTFKF